MECSSCGTTLEDIQVIINLGINVKRIKSDGTWEIVPNSINNPKEILCKKCFDNFVSIIDETFNKEK